MQSAGIWLQTARLRLRPVAASDEGGVLAGLNDPEIASWLSTVPYPYTAQDFRAYLASATEGETFAIHDDRGFAGLIGGGTELGFWIARHAQGRGYATEAAVGLLQAMFSFWDGAVLSGYFVGNTASARVLAKLGFSEIGRAPRFCRPLGQDMLHVDVLLAPSTFRALYPAA